MKMDIRSAAILIGFAAAVLSGLATALSGPGSRMEWWNFREGFAILKWAMFGGLLSAVLCAGGLIASLRGKIFDYFGFAISGLAIGLVIAAIPLSAWRTGRRVPVINDITTDTQDPPEFSAILPLRAGATSPAEYGGPQIAAQQLKAYPEVKPFISALPPGSLFEKAIGDARWMGWKIIASSKEKGRIEAVDTTFWFGFKDDIVIRVLPDGKGSRLDIRSHSRVGKSDLGTNARRIMQFLKNLPRTNGA